MIYVHYGLLAAAMTLSPVFAQDMCERFPQMANSPYCQSRPVPVSMNGSFSVLEHRDVKLPAIEHGSPSVMSMDNKPLETIKGAWPSPGQWGGGKKN